MFISPCPVPAATCKGTYHRLVQIHRPDNYRDIPANLNIVITAT